jgi:predicted ribosomally synthesized peptide with nif11-like leader
MSDEQASAFFDRLEADEDFAKELESLRDDPDAVLERIHAAGFDTTPVEMRETFLERYGAELTPEQMEQVAAGVDTQVVAASVGGVVMVAWLGAAAAALA